MREHCRAMLARKLAGHARSGMRTRRNNDFRFATLGALAMEVIRAYSKGMLEMPEGVDEDIVTIGRDQWRATRLPNGGTHLKLIPCEFDLPIGWSSYSDGECWLSPNTPPALKTPVAMVVQQVCKQEHSQ
jgi:hypothetical protein